MHNYRKKKVVVLSIILCSVMFLTIVCASFTTDMFISGNAYVRTSQNIRIIGVEATTMTNDAVENSAAKYSAKAITIDANLPNINSTITYTVTIKNNTNDIYMIDQITPTLSNENITNNISTYEGQIIQGGQTVTLNLTFSYSGETLPQNTIQTGSIVFSIVRPSAQAISYSSEYTNQTNLQDAIDELYELLDS